MWSSLTSETPAAPSLSLTIIYFYGMLCPGNKTGKANHFKIIHHRQIRDRFHQENKRLKFRHPSLNCECLYFKALDPLAVAR